jgi:hypothetical protein
VKREKGHQILAIEIKKNIVDTDLKHQNKRYLCQMVPFDERSSY